jgi:hypothetical protein
VSQCLSQYDGLDSEVGSAAVAAAVGTGSASSPVRPIPLIRALERGKGDDATTEGLIKAAAVAANDSAFDGGFATAAAEADKAGLANFGAPVGRGGGGGGAKAIFEIIGVSSLRSGLSPPAPFRRRRADGARAGCEFVRMVNGSEEEAERLRRPIRRAGPLER